MEGRDTTPNSRPTSMTFEQKHRFQMRWRNKQLTYNLKPIQPGLKKVGPNLDLEEEQDRHLDTINTLMMNGFSWNLFFNYFLEFYGKGVVFHTEKKYTGPVNGVNVCLAYTCGT